MIDQGTRRMKLVTEANFTAWAVLLLLLTVGCSSEYAADEYAVGMAEGPLAFNDVTGGEDIALNADDEGDETIPHLMQHSRLTAN